LVRVKLTGELDLAVAHLLGGRLSEFQDQQLAVRLDLSELEFMDSIWLNLVVRAADDARRDGWRFEVERDVSPPVGRLFELAGIESFLWGENDGSEPRANSRPPDRPPP
jgi:anti-anti-sigma factor